MIARSDVVIVGAGHAGAQTAIALRQNGHDGSITVFSDETSLPYERPPLTKDFLADEISFERLIFREQSYWDEIDVRLQLGAQIVSVDPKAQTVTQLNGARHGYGSLVWATGGKPRSLAPLDESITKVFTIRGRADVEALKQHLPKAQKITIIGGGYIGLEASAVMRGLGKDVTLLEASDRILSRVTGQEISDFFAACHANQGVKIKTQALVKSIDEASAGSLCVLLDNGEHIDAHLVIVGIGIDPSVAPLIDAGADGQNGVDVDHYCRTSVPNVYAIGDCACHLNRFAAGKRIRLESVQNANAQAIIAAKSIAGKPQPYDAVPWFWSHQYDIKLQTAGLFHDFDNSIVRRYNDTSFSVVYTKNGKIVAVDCVNAMKDYIQGRKLVSSGARLSETLVVDSANQLKDCIVSA
ncbi:MAG: FAD-dependent oxidoreductase [Pseudomonadota bacterium]